MADMRKDEEGNVAGKRKLDLPNSINETFDQTAEAKEVGSESSKRQKLDTNSENETNISCSFLISGKMAETEDGVAASKEAESESSKRQKLEISLENEANVGCSFLINGKMAEAEDGTEASKVDDKDEHLEVEAEIVHRGRRYTAAEKGKGILVEESDEESDYDDDDSSDGSDSDFSDGLDSGSEDIPF